MRTWGRVNGVWTEVTTDANGYNDAVYVTTLAQVLKLGLGESPFFANYGIPAEQSVISQIQPDYYVMRTQQQFAQFFGTLIISKQAQLPNRPDPTYSLQVTTKQGAVVTGPIPV